jgi:glycine cleavage system H lipoate-binding protein
LNESAEDQGWILEIEPKDFEGEKGNLLDAEAYKKHVESEAH